MSKDKQKPAPPPENDESKSLILFGENITMLPKQLEEMGLAGKVEVREIPGVAPDWKPVNPGDFILGRCVDIREVDTRFTKTDGNGNKTNVGHCAVFETAIPGGFRTVWLGADLRIKIKNAIGAVFSIEYIGSQDIGKGNPMKQYRVCEVLPVGAVRGEIVG